MLRILVYGTLEKSALEGCAGLIIVQGGTTLVDQIYYTVAQMSGTLYSYNNNTLSVQVRWFTQYNPIVELIENPTMH